MSQTQGQARVSVGELGAVPAGCRRATRLVIAGQSIYALVDTGAAHSLMAELTFLNICQGSTRPSLVQPSLTVCALGGVPLKTVGQTEVRVEGAGPLDVIIVADLPHELILGSDALNSGHAILDYPKNHLRWYGNSFTLLPYTDSPRMESGRDRSSVAPVSIYTSTGHACIDNVLKDFPDVFSDTNPTLGFCKDAECTINTADAQPIYQRPYRTPLAKRAEVTQQIKDMLKSDVIRPGVSPWASPITLQPKKDGTLRFCVDYRKLISVTIPDRYPSVLIQDIFDHMSGTTIFSTLDLQSGYWQIPVASKDQPKTSFTCFEGTFIFQRMPFGLSNAPAQFQRTMDKVLQGLIGKCCFVYLDDIVIHSTTPEQHAEHLSLVLQRLRKAGLRVKTKKCHFARDKVPLLGYIVSKDGLQADPDKVTAIANMRPPETPKELKRFLGMCGFYAQLCPRFAHVAAPLRDLLKKNVKWQWTDGCQSSFKQLQDLLQSDKVLMCPRLGQPYRLYTDASGYAVGGILTQLDETGHERVIQYVSHQLNDTQRRWAAIEREAYAIVNCLQKLRPYLWGASFRIFSDHRPLLALFQNQVANTKIQRWAVLIAEFGAPIEYCSGKKNIRADFLSRLRPVEVDVIDTVADVEPQTDYVTWSLPLHGIDQAELAQEQDEHFAQEMQLAADHEARDNILFSCRRPGAKQAQYPRILLPPKWQLEVIRHCHEQTGHAGVWRTLCAIRAYEWPGMQRHVKDYIRACGLCQVYKATPKATPYTRMPEPFYPHQIIGMDLTGPFARSQHGHTYLLNFVCHLTGWADCYPIANKRGDTVANILQREYIPRYGPPEVIISDNGREFVCEPVAQVCRAAGIEHRTTTPYRPQSNSKVERFHRTLKGLLERLMAKNSSSWETQLGPALAAYRSTATAGDGMSPFQKLYGRQMRQPLTVGLRNNPAAAEALQDDRVAAMTNIWQHARQALHTERQRNEDQQRRHKLTGQLSIGDQVIVLIPGLKRTFHPRWDARWQVIRARHPVYWIHHVPTGRQKVIHRDKLHWVPTNTDWSMSAPDGDTQREVQHLQAPLPMPTDYEHRQQPPPSPPPPPLNLPPPNRPPARSDTPPMGSPMHSHTTAPPPWPRSSTPTADALAPHWPVPPPQSMTTTAEPTTDATAFYEYRDPRADQSPTPPGSPHPRVAPDSADTTHDSDYFDAADYQTQSTIDAPDIFLGGEASHQPSDTESDHDLSQALGGLQLQPTDPQQPPQEPHFTIGRSDPRPTIDINQRRYPLRKRRPPHYLRIEQADQQTTRKHSRRSRKDNIALVDAYPRVSPGALQALLDYYSYPQQVELSECSSDQ